MSTDNKGASFSYNAANALTQVSLASGAKESDYYYANGLRAVAQSNTQVLVHYYSHDNQLLNSSDGAQQSSAYLIANNVTVRSVMGDATVLLHNRHGSVIAHLGDKSQFYQYSVYGVQKTEDRGQKTENKNGSLVLATNPLRYSGYMFDPLTGLYYLKARDYNPSLRSFIQADSYAFNKQGLINGYFYGNNNPLMGVDPSGHVFDPSGNVFDPEEINKWIDEVASVSGESQDLQESAMQNISTIPIHQQFHLESSVNMPKKVSVTQTTLDEHGRVDVTLKRTQIKQMSESNKQVRFHGDDLKSREIRKVQSSSDPIVSVRNNSRLRANDQGVPEGQLEQRFPKSIFFFKLIVGVSIVLTVTMAPLVILGLELCGPGTDNSDICTSQ
uniref:RHS repeat-associated core domain-containing protein n=1 Tax=Cysteiniphilum halobium TaxID=2219059 RepID=UPI003F870130